MLDPLGRSVTLHDATWYGHILKRHPDLRILRRSVEETVRGPAEVRFSSYVPACRVYYAKLFAMMMAVVVNVDEAVVLTAYRTTRMKGAVEWSASIP